MRCLYIVEGFQLNLTYISVVRLSMDEKGFSRSKVTVMTDLLNWQRHTFKSLWEVIRFILCCDEQSKEKLIASLKENPSSGGKSGNDSAALLSELESVRQERDILQDELRSSQHMVDSVRSELTVSNSCHCLDISITVIID